MKYTSYTCTQSHEQNYTHICIILIYLLFHCFNKIFFSHFTEWIWIRLIIHFYKGENFCNYTFNRVDNNNVRPVLVFFSSHFNLIFFSSLFIRLTIHHFFIFFFSFFTWKTEKHSKGKKYFKKDCCWYIIIKARDRLKCLCEAF